MDIIKIILPVLLISSLAIYTIRITKKKSARQKPEEIQKDDTHMSEGMAIGMCLGTAIGISLGEDNLAIGMSVGMLVGMLAGMNYKK